MHQPGRFSNIAPVKTLRFLEGGRKATCSYCTPDHIVKYIIERAVGPVLLEHFDAVRPKLRKAEKERKAFFKKQEGLAKAGMQPETGPEAAAYEATWGWIEAHLTSDRYPELGGPLRLVLEDFLKRTADKIELKMRYRMDGRYTSGDFTGAGMSTSYAQSYLLHVQGMEKM